MFLFPAQTCQLVEIWPKSISLIFGCFNEVPKIEISSLQTCETLYVQSDYQVHAATAL